MLGSEPSSRGNEIAAGAKRQIRPHCHGSLHLAHRCRRKSIAQDRVMPRHYEGYAEHPSDRDSQPTRLQSVRMHQIGANKPALAGERPNIKAKLGEPLGLGRGLWAEDPDLVTALLQPWCDARYVTPDAAGTDRQQLCNLHSEPTSADRVRRRSAHSWASSEGARSRSIAVNTKTQSTARVQAPSTAATMPTSVKSCEPVAPTPAASTAAARPTNIGLASPTAAIPDCRNSTHPAIAPTTIPSETLPASAGTSQSAGTNGRTKATLTITAVHAPAFAMPDALPMCWASKVRDASPSSVNPTTAGANAAIGQASASVRPEPGPSTNTRATGTAVATKTAAPSHAMTTIAGPVSESTWPTSARLCPAAAASRGKVSCSSGAASTA